MVEPEVVWPEPTWVAPCFVERHALLVDGDCRVFRLVGQGDAGWLRYHRICGPELSRAGRWVRRTWWVRRLWSPAQLGQARWWLDRGGVLRQDAWEAGYRGRPSATTVAYWRFAQALTQTQTRTGAASLPTVGLICRVLTAEQITAARAAQAEFAPAAGSTPD